MRIAVIALASALFLFSHPVAHSADQKVSPASKPPELRQIQPKKPVKIKLKRTAKDDYSWELSGDDADEIVRIDRKLRKLLNVQ